MSGVVKPEPAAGAAQDGDEGTPTGPQLNPVEQALLAARERLSAGDGMTPAAEPEGGEGGESDEGGIPEATPPDEGTPPGEAGEEEGKPGESEGAEEGQVVDEGGEGTEGAEGAEGGEGEGDEGAVDPDLVVPIPARREGDEDLELVLDDPEMAERIRQLNNSAIRGEQLRTERAKVEQDQAAIEDMEAQISTDPVGFIMGNVPEDVVEVVAMSLITQPKIWERVQDKLDTLNDPSTLRLMQAELKAERLEAQGTLRERAEIRREARKQANLVLEGIHRMVPATDGITESRRETIIQSVQTVVAASIRDAGLQKVNVQDLPLLAATALRQHGIDPIAAAAALQEGESAGSEPGKKKPPAKGKQKTAKQLKAESDKRKKAAAGTPPGSGAPAASPKLPAGQTIEERIKLAREKGIGNLMGGK